MGLEVSAAHRQLSLLFLSFVLVVDGPADRAGGGGDDRDEDGRGGLVPDAWLSGHADLGPPLREALPRCRFPNMQPVRSSIVDGSASSSASSHAASSRSTSSASNSPRAWTTKAPDTSRTRPVWAIVRGSPTSWRIARMSPG
ncbi:hypothetical protein ACFV1U_37190, partial [Streptomyces microflavus]